MSAPFGEGAARKRAEAREAQDFERKKREREQLARLKSRAQVAGEEAVVDLRKRYEDGDEYLEGWSAFSRSVNKLDGEEEAIEAILSELHSAHPALRFEVSVRTINASDDYTQGISARIRD